MVKQLFQGNRALCWRRHETECPSSKNTRNNTRERASVCCFLERQNSAKLSPPNVAPCVCSGTLATVSMLPTQLLNWTLLRQRPVPSDLLDRGLVSAPRGADYMRLLNKLESGRPVTILAIGSSLVGVHAGCTEPIPALRGCACPACCGARCGGWGTATGGWARLMMEQLNQVTADWLKPGET